MYKILIVEDDETIARLLGEHLENGAIRLDAQRILSRWQKNLRSMRPILFSWISDFRFIMDFTGAQRSGRRQTYQSYFCHRCLTI